MAPQGGSISRGRVQQRIAAVVILAIAAVATSCRGKPSPSLPSSSKEVLRVGVGQFAANNPLFGLRQLAQILTLEGLARAGLDGRMQPWLADSLTRGSNDLSVTITLRPTDKFQDGTPVAADAVVALLRDALRSFMGSLFSDIESIRATSPHALEIRFRQSSPLLLEALESQIRKPEMIGTGPFAVAADSPTELRANTGYHLGSPTIGRITVANYPNVRAAWAEMLRGNLDMLYEVGTDALDSLKGSNDIATFTFTRPYQYLVALNSEAPALKSPEVRRALNFAIDRAAAVRKALNGHGVPSSGPISPRYWAASANMEKFEFDPKRADETLEGAKRRDRSARLRFTCLVLPDAISERLALEIKRQLAEVGVEMVLEPVTQEEITRRAANRDYEAAMIELVSGPTLLRLYIAWHSNGPINWGKFGNPTIDRALDEVRRAPTEPAYKDAVAGLQRAFMENPPAIFLAWSERARAVSKRFIVPTAEPGRDILSTLRLWKPTPDVRRQASRN